MRQTRHTSFDITTNAFSQSYWRLIPPPAQHHLRMRPESVQIATNNKTGRVIIVVGHAVYSHKKLRDLAATVSLSCECCTQNVSAAAVDIDDMFTQESITQHSWQWQHKVIFSFKFHRFQAL